MCVPNACAKRVSSFGVSDCPTTPPDYDKCIAAAQKVVKEKPFGVIWATSLYATVYDVWSRAGIVSLGGSSFDNSFYNRGRPFRYDLGMDEHGPFIVMKLIRGQSLAEMIAEARGGPERSEMLPRFVRLHAARLHRGRALDQGLRRDHGRPGRAPARAEWLRLDDRRRQRHRLVRGGRHRHDRR